MEYWKPPDHLDLKVLHCTVIWRCDRMTEERQMVLAFSTHFAIVLSIKFSACNEIMSQAHLLLNWVKGWYFWEISQKIVWFLKAGKPNGFDSRFRNMNFYKCNHTTQLRIQKSFIFCLVDCCYLRLSHFFYFFLHIGAEWNFYGIHSGTFNFCHYILTLLALTLKSLLQNSYIKDKDKRFKSKNRGKNLSTILKGTRHYCTKFGTGLHSILRHDLKKVKHQRNDILKNLKDNII